MNILKQLAQLQQLSVALAVGFKLGLEYTSVMAGLQYWYTTWYSLDVQHHPRPPRDARTSE